MAEHTIKVDQEVEARYAKLVAALEAAADFASMGERVQKALPDLPLPPADIVVKYGGPDGRDPNPNFGSRCARYSLIQMIGACEEYLLQLMFLSKITKEIADSNGAIPAHRLETIREEVIRNTSLWHLFEGLLRILGRERKAVYGRSWFSSLERIRNCLVHRRGIVGASDVNSRTGFLEAVWQKTTIVAPGGQIIGSLPFLVEEGGQLRISSADEMRSWKIGEPIMLTAQDCHDMAFSLARFCDEVRIQVLAGIKNLLPVEPQATRGRI